MRSSKQYAVKSAEDSANKLFDNAVAVLERAKKEIELYKKKFNEANPRMKPVVMSWAVNGLAANVQGNLRLDLFVTSACNLTEANNLLD